MGLSRQVNPERNEGNDNARGLQTHIVMPVESVLSKAVNKPIQVIRKPVDKPVIQVNKPVDKPVRTVREHQRES